nr:hypothetical protein [Tanacetum cinerariifolium]
SGTSDARRRHHPGTSRCSHDSAGMRAERTGAGNQSRREDSGDRHWRRQRHRRPGPGAA